MIGLDTNILARYYMDDEEYHPKSVEQRAIAKKILETYDGLYLSLTVLIEFEWILRGVYKLSVREVILAYEHLLTFNNIKFERKNVLLKAIDFAKQGIEFTDAFHLASYEKCEKMYSFDDKGFAKKVDRQGFKPPVVVPTLKQ